MVKEIQAELQRDRVEFRDRMARAGASQVWKNFAGRIGVVLPGGGGRGSYEAGALLAFQDAAVPTHLLTGTSIGAINAASYAAQSKTLVGDAETLVKDWFNLTPAAVGIEWDRYLWMIGGLLAASAGAGNLATTILASNGYSIELPSPRMTWALLGLLGAAVLFLYDQLPYLGYILRNFFRGRSWKPDPWKTVWTLAANVIVWGCLFLLLKTLHARYWAVHLFSSYTPAVFAVAVVIALLVAFRHQGNSRVSWLMHQLLRLPFRRGLFANFERTRLLRRTISPERLRMSPIRILFPATDIETGPVSYFSNAAPGDLANDPGADRLFVQKEVANVADLILALVASSALPLAFEPIAFREHLYTDGGLVSNQPIRPAIRLGADVLFLVMMDPLSGPRGKVRTFLDMGLRALNILMVQNFLTDRRILQSVNAICERCAAQKGLRPEEVEVDLGTRKYRYVKFFTINPSVPLEGTILDFGGVTTGKSILRGYRDACMQIEAFLEYAPDSGFGKPRQVFELHS